jgi:hypothetical protein
MVGNLTSVLDAPDSSSLPAVLSRQRSFSVHHTPFWLITLSSLAGYIGLHFWFPLSPFFNQIPLADIRTFTPSIGSGLAYAAWLCFMFALYGLAYRRIREWARPPNVAIILLAAFLFGLPLLQTFPVNATDIYRYFIRGRVSSQYDQSPFEAPPDSFPDDPYLPLAGEWAGETSPYGPMWELIAAGITNVFPDDLYSNLILFKSLSLLVHLLTALLIWQMSSHQNRSERMARCLLWAWNPALLLTFVVNAHNDGFMLLWLLLGLWMVRRHHLTMGFWIMVLAPLTKPIGLLPLPFFFAAMWRLASPGQERLRFLFLSLSGGLALVFLTFLPFGSPLFLAQRLLREASAGGSFSLPVLFILIARALGSDLSLIRVNQISVALFGLVVLWLLWLTWNKRSALRGAADVFVAYFILALNFRIWYAVWPFPWLLMDSGEDPASGRRLRAGLWLLLTAQFSVLIYGHMRVFWLARSHLWAHLIGVPFTFALPVFLAFRPWARYRSRH